MTYALPTDPLPTRIDKTRWRAWLPTVAFFQLIYVLAHVHRQILSIVVGPAKISLGLSDFQIGLLQGFAFTVVISIAVVLTAPIVDRGNRVRFLGLCIAIWSTMTVSCGFAENFGMLLASRTGTAIAEAVVPMAVMSLICDIVPRSTVPRAAALFLAAPFLGSGIMLLAGGPLLAWLEEYRTLALPLIGPLEPWRSLFVLLGAPGLIVAILFLATMQEPARQEPLRQENNPSNLQTESLIPFFLANVSFFASVLSLTGITAAVTYAVYAWVPTYMIRVHGLDVKTAGLEIGTIFVISGILGSVFGSWIMSQSTSHDALSHVVRTMVRLSFVSGPLLVLMALSTNSTIALILLAIIFLLLAALFSSVLTPPALVAPPHLRARVIAVCSVVISALGGCGPLLVGAITDFTFKTPNRIADSLAITFAGACVIWVIAGPIASRMATRIDEEQSSSGK